jgi:hypothetical protein
MKANPLACALLVLLAVAIQLPAKQPTTNAAEQKISPSGINAADVPDFTILKPWEDFQIVEARQRYEEDARTNHITLDKPQYNNAPWSEIRLRASALKGDGLAASLCYGNYHRTAATAGALTDFTFREIGHPSESQTPNLVEAFSTTAGRLVASKNGGKH